LKNLKNRAEIKLWWSAGLDQGVSGFFEPNEQEISSINRPEIKREEVATNGPALVVSNGD